MEMVDIASAVGMDAIKFQTFNAVYAVLPKQIDLESGVGHSNIEQKLRRWMVSEGRTETVEFNSSPSSTLAAGSYLGRESPYLPAESLPDYLFGCLGSFSR